MKTRSKMLEEGDQLTLDFTKVRKVAREGVITAMFDADRIGVIASTICAIHCAVTPLLLLILPTFGRVWVHPASHWGMAIVVVPIAAAMMSKGYQRHRRAWILAIGTAGILLVVLGAAAPYFEKSYEAWNPVIFGEGNSDVQSGETALAKGCMDSCCPALVVQENGSQRLQIPIASILTTAGGLFLIVTHLGNLCCCPSCQRKKTMGSGD